MQAPSNPADFRLALTGHLRWWGLRRFQSDDEYFKWQRESIPQPDLLQLNRLVEQKQTPTAGSTEEVAFYDHAARPPILPVIHSQQYDYYLTLGAAIAERIADSQSVLDFGCGVGVLTTFYASLFPDRSFVGIDRSAASIAAAQERASALGLNNIKFKCLDTEHPVSGGPHDLIVATHALLQTERDPGLPSRTWKTFERAHIPALQSAFEQRTGLGTRLDWLARGGTVGGRLIVFEKARQLARRIPLQRALTARGFCPLEPPLPLRYMVVEETVDDGPLYVLGRGADHISPWPWDERPEISPGQDVYRCSGAPAEFVLERLPSRTATDQKQWVDAQLGQCNAELGHVGHVLTYLSVRIADQFRGVAVAGRRSGTEALDQIWRELDHARLGPGPISEVLEKAWGNPSGHDATGQTPLYENHTESAQGIWSELSERRVLRDQTREEGDGRQLHLELGSVEGLTYLYFANTFDQRQLVVVETPRSALLAHYYEELQQGADR
ncbi:MAG: class I SAM-dependent methyltransferase [Nitrospiraceae bacterium]